jgi:hypothetical protein
VSSNAPKSSPEIVKEPQVVCGVLVGAKTLTAGPAQTQFVTQPQRRRTALMRDLRLTCIITLDIESENKDDGATITQ